jgi:putative ATP-binding cassette transporter
MNLATEESLRDPHIAITASDTRDLLASALTVTLPTGKPLTAAANLRVGAGDRVLLTGRSGSGKTTLFRAFSGIWPFGHGRIEVPRGATLFVLPQRTYLPLGTLRQALTYPRTVEAYPSEAVREALEAVGLEFLGHELDDAGNWSQRLSGGEQQRLGVARALLVRPDFLFLDEATSALDEPAEAEIYRTLIDKLPATAIVSIAHRASLAQFHTREVSMQRAADGLFRPTDPVAQAAE